LYGTQRTKAALALILVLAAAGAAGCGGGGRAESATAERATTTAPDAVRAAAPAADAAIPSAPRPLAARLRAAEAAIHDAIDDWRRDGGPAGGALPAPVAAEARYVRRAVHRLAGDHALAAATIQRLPGGTAGEARDMTAALADLHKLSAGWPAHQVETGAPTPLGVLVPAYHSAQARFGVGWRYLAAINLVESAFGRVRSHSVAGAQGPMQFMPSSWRAYGLGGDIRDPHDAILAAANLLHQAGAPTDYGHALYSYNPSNLYVDAVRRYAGVIGRDPDALYVLYSWPSP
jgi:membrane-bound lytic murein transglycosylase B